MRRELEEENGETELLLKNGECKLVCSRWWEWSEKRQRFTVCDRKWDWDGTPQEGNLDLQKFRSEEQGWYDQANGPNGCSQALG